MLIGAAVTAEILVLLARGTAATMRWRIFPILLASLVLCLADVAGRRGLTFPHRQTYSGAISFGGRTGQLLWGFDIGLGFTTYRTTRLYWAGLLMLAAGLPSVLCFAGCFSYVLLLLIAMRRSRDRHFIAPEDWLLPRRRAGGLIGAVTSMALLGVVISVR